MEEPKLHEYQVNHLERLKKIFTYSIAASDTSPTGSGKTYVGCKLAKDLNLDIIVVGPVALQDKWSEIADKFNVPLEFISYESLRTAGVTGKRYIKKENREPNDVLDNNDAGVDKQYIPSAVFLKKVVAGVLLVLDEHHMAKNVKTDNYRSVKCLVDSIVCCDTIFGNHKCQKNIFGVNTPTTIEKYCKHLKGTDPVKIRSRVLLCSATPGDKIKNATTMMGLLGLYTHYKPWRTITEKVNKYIELTGYYMVTEKVRQLENMKDVIQTTIEGTEVPVMYVKVVKMVQGEKGSEYISIFPTNEFDKIINFMGYEYVDVEGSIEFYLKNEVGDLVTDFFPKYQYEETEETEGDIILKETGYSIVGSRLEDCRYYRIEKRSVTFTPSPLPAPPERYTADPSGEYASTIEFYFSTIYSSYLKYYLSSEMEPPTYYYTKTDIRNSFFEPVDEENRKEVSAAYRDLEMLPGSEMGSGEMLAAIQKAISRIHMSKVPIVVNEAKKILDNTRRKVIIFTKTKDVVEGLAAGLKSYKPIVITGSSKKTERRENISKFQEDNDEERLLIINIIVGGIGIDLDDQYGNYPRTAFLFPDYTFSSLIQALGRICRMKTRSVSIANFVYVAGYENEVTIMESLFNKVETLTNLTISDKTYLMPSKEDFFSKISRRNESDIRRTKIKVKGREYPEEGEDNKEMRENVFKESLSIFLPSLSTIETYLKMKAGSISREKKKYPVDDSFLNTDFKISENVMLEYSVSLKERETYFFSAVERFTDTPIRYYERELF